MKVRTPLLRLFLTFSLLVSMLAFLQGHSWTIEIPATLHDKIPVSAAEILGSVAKPLPFNATYLGFEWEDDEAPPSIRTRAEGEGWSSWTRLEESEDLSDHTTGQFFSPLVYAPEARWVQVARPSGVKPRAVTISVINTKDGPVKRFTAPRRAEAATPQPNVISRAQWGADESLRKGAPSFARVRRIFVHHTVTANNDPDPASAIRGIYSYHTQSRGWNDIGYNFLVDSSGNVYEGRYSRQYGQGELPAGENLNGEGVIGAHVSNYNTGSVGIAMLGEFGSVGPAGPALDGLVNFAAWKADRHSIEPLGAYGGFPTIAGHRDAGATACPGDQLYAQLPNVRNRVEQRISALTNQSAPSMPTGTELMPRSYSKDLTPNASGAVSRSAQRVELTFTGSIARTLTALVSDGEFSITDATYAGTKLAPDRYRVTATAYDALDRASPQVLVDNEYLITGGKAPVGYWVMGTDGGIFSYGAAGFYGSTGGMRLNQPAVGMDATPTGAGYWLVASDGGIFSFGDAGFYGSTGAMALNKPVVGMASTPSGRGYWLVASDGGIFSFGDAGFYGSTGAMALNKPVVGMASTPSGRGYWLVASDGGIFSFGDAEFFGSTGNIKLNKPIVGMAGTGTGSGYWMVGEDGGIFSFGDAPYKGSLPGKGVSATASKMNSSGTGTGYYIVTRAGSIYDFGDAPWYGSPASQGFTMTAIDMAIVF